jgi:acyl carrier protein
MAVARNHTGGEMSKAHKPASIASTAAIVIEIIADTILIDEKDITPGSRITEDLEADATDTIEIYMVIEERFGISFDDEGPVGVETVQNLIDLVEGVVDKAKK